MENNELASILERVKKGDNDAISALVREYSGRVQNMAKIYGGDDIDVKDVTVHAFARTIRNLDKLQDPSGFEEFLYGYVRQEAMKSERKKESQDIPEPRPVPEVPVHSEKDSISIPSFKPSVPAEPQIEEASEEEDSTAEQKEVEVPVRKPRKKVVEEEEEYEDDEEDEEDDDDYEEERGGFPGWLLIILIVIAIIILVCLGMYFFMPELWDTVAESANRHLPVKLPYAEKAEEEETSESHIETAAPLATMTAAPVASAEVSSTPTVDTESILEGGDAAPLTTPTPTPSATVTPASTPAQQSSGVIGKVTINVDNLNIRASASTSSESKGHASKGTAYDVYETTTGEGYTWYRIGDGQWIADNGSWVSYTAG